MKTSRTSPPKNKLKWYQSINTKIVFVIVALLFFALEFIGANFINQLQDELVSSHKQDRQTQIEFIETSAEPYLTTIQNRRAGAGVEQNPDPYQEISALLSEFSGRGNLNLQIVSPNLSIIGTSSRTDQNLVGQRTNDADIRQVLLTNESVNKEYVDANSNERRWKNVSPIYASDGDRQLLGVIMLESNIETVYQQVNTIAVIFLQASLVTILITGILGFVLAKEIVNPIIAIQEGTQKIAGGNYSVNLENNNVDEIGQLSHSINELAHRVWASQESINAERHRLESVLKHMSDGVVATNRLGDIIIVNTAAQDMLKLDSEEVLGQDITSFLDLDRTVQDLYDNPEEDIMIEIGERFIRLNFSMIESEAKTIQGIICVLHDVTEEENIERDRKAFVSNVSHELRTPLTSMRSYVEALNDGAWRDPSIAPQFLTVIQSETDRMIRMVSDLLQLSRIDTGNEQFDKELVDLTALFTHVLDRFDMLIKSENRNFIIERDLPNESAWTEIDQDRLIQALDNIMNNAIKYSPDGGTIKGTMKLNSDQVLLSISDQGLGIPKQDLPRIFSRFYRVDKARSRAMGGTGLGLAITKEVVDQHGGKIWVRSQENKGTTFYITLPIEVLDFEEEEEWE